MSLSRSKRSFKVVRTLSVTAMLLALMASRATSQQAAPALTDADRAAIQALMGQYAQALGGCRAAEFADLFVPETGAFASGFRGRMVGRTRLIALVESERQCATPPAAPKAAPPGQDKAKAVPAPRPAPTSVLDVTASGVRGIATVGGAEYQDEYAKTPRGWRFASRTVITTAEKAAGLDARAIVAIERLGAGKLIDHYEPDQSGVSRLMTSGVKVTAMGDQVTGRAYLKDGAYDDNVYEKLASGEWRVKSSTHVSAPAR